MLSLRALEALIVRWAEGERNVLALISTGSTARGDGREDEFSDLDVEVIAEAPNRLLETDEWFRAFGEVWVVLRFNEPGFPARLVVYEGGAKVDYTIAGAERLTEMYGGLDALYERGYKVLLDKPGLTKRLPRPTGSSPVLPAPSAREFFSVLDEFWFEATHMPRYLSRGDLWVVKLRDWTMKQDLLRMLEWHALTRSSGPVAVWHLGAHLREWVEEQTWQDLHDVFGRFAEDDAWRALLATTHLFARLSHDVAHANGFDYPIEVEQHVQRYLAAHAPPSQDL